MRLWHYKLIKYLPRQQLLSQWRELNSIYVKQDNHILINYIYKHDKFSLMKYSIIVVNEIKSRGYNIKNFDNFESYFEISIDDAINKINNDTRNFIVYNDYQNDDYLKICCWNLYEKYLRGQSGFTDECIKYIKEAIYES